MLSKKKQRDLIEAGKDYAGDWLAWGNLEKKTIEQQYKYVNSFDGQSEAYDMAMCSESEKDAGGAADFIYEGMCSVVRPKHKELKEKLEAAKSVEVRNE